MDPLLAYTLAPKHLSAFYIPRGSGKTTWEPTSSSTSTTAPSFCAEILWVEQPCTPQIQQVYCAMDPLLAYTLAPMHLSAFYIPRGSGKTTWEPTSSSTSTTAPCFCAEISWVKRGPSPQIQQVYGAMDPLLAYTLAPNASSTIASRATDRPTESLNHVAAVSTEDIIANRAAPPPGPSPPPGGGAVRIRDIQFPAMSAACKTDMFEVDGGHGPTQWTRRRVEGTRPSRIVPVVAPNIARGSEKVTQKKVHQRKGPKLADFALEYVAQGGSGEKVLHEDLLGPMPQLVDTVESRTGGQARLRTVRVSAHLGILG
ncbi:hypothetical protein THAOC_28273, partial [Thalassiosira oceanica]